MKFFDLVARIGIGVVAVTSGMVWASPSPGDGVSPNILWISCEDMSPNISPFGDKLAQTPHLQKLADDGLTFLKAFSTSPVCSPSRSTIITGVYAAVLGTHNHRSDVKIPERIRPFPSYLREAGYYCTNNSKTDYNFAVRADAWDDNSRSAHWRNRPDADQPFFAVFNLTVTHELQFMMPEAKFIESTRDVKQRTDPAKVTLPPYFPDTPVTRKDRARYYDSIAQMDIQVGRILEELNQDGLSTSTVVVFFSDHGEGLPRGKRWLYDTGLHVPLIVRWPGVVKPNTRTKELASLIDLAPTMLAVAGIRPKPYMPGRTLFGPSIEPAPELLFATRDRMDETYDMMRSVRSNEYKYIKNFYPEIPYFASIKYLDNNPTMKELRQLHEDGTLTGAATLYFAPHKPAEELYDLAKDPYELINLAGDKDYETTLSLMRKELADWQVSVKDKGNDPDPGNPRKNPNKIKRNKKKSQ